MKQRFNLDWSEPSLPRMLLPSNEMTNSSSNPACELLSTY